jgi:hypothetical protein
LSAEYDRLRELLLQFPDFQKPFQNYDAAEQAILGQVIPRHLSVDRAYLESKFPAATCRAHMSEDNAYIFMTPFSEGAHTYLPLLSVDLAFNVPWPLVSINALHYAIRSADVAGTGALRCFGYRYDKPPVAHGDHNYFHVQFAHGFPSDKRNNCVDDWISRKDPSIPVDATNAVELFLSAVVALRRKKPQRQYLDEWAQAGLPIHALMKPMALERWKPPKPQPGGQPPA